MPIMNWSLRHAMDLHSDLDVIVRVGMVNIKQFDFRQCSECMSITHRRIKIFVCFRYFFFFSKLYGFSLYYLYVYDKNIRWLWIVMIYDYLYRIYSIFREHKIPGSLIDISVLR